MAKSHQHSVASQVRVVLRVRPFLPCETQSKEKGAVPCVSVLDSENDTGEEEVTVHLKDQWTSRNECYKLDAFFIQENSVDEIFKSEVSTVIPGIFRGLNATIFAYGATGSGKTYTMQGTEEEPGLIPLAMSSILSMCRGSECSVEISYYEVYMDRCYDLLEPKTKEILPLDDKEGRVQLKGLSWVLVHSMDEFNEVFSTGIQRRKVAHTGLNDVSSRSHGVLTIAVSNGAVRGKLNLIDLAGNEDNRRTGNEGIRLMESAKINQSLLALSNVIYALNNNEPRVPYRASKLTRVLQDCLGGTSRALMIACINPSSYQEAVHTVSLAARSRQVVNYVDGAKEKETPTVKVDMEAKLRLWLESKGKSKSINRMNGPCSPFFGRTPNSTLYHKKAGSIQSSARTKASENGVFESKGRRLFDSALSTTAANEVVVQDVASVDTMPLVKEATEGCELHDNAVRGLPLDDAMSHYSPTKSIASLQISDKSEVPPNTLRKVLSPISNNITPNKHPASDLLDTHSFKNELNSPVHQNPGTPLIRKSQLQELQKSLQKVLSPVLNNSAQNENLMSNKICVVLLDPNAPKTPHVILSDHDKVGMDNSPLGKFNASNSNLKESLVQEYLDFLNVASKEQLMKLKGIGEKRAENILQLREHSPKPLKSLSDLEKIGLSSKQVCGLLRGHAREMFA
ncbi:Plus-end-directed kinesin ATPase protein [Dioscorea alata]|uniref:Plus-end-directed kinesin ATPase protein n=1 Tax=Dioscorea alata TaxID=55571 RepID=A0ACB7VGA4_DIOAL|nr:Plus-end-directed kinesin ATPase protein [Dioscorea alata]